MGPEVAPMLRTSAATKGRTHYFFFFNRLTHHNSRLLCVTRGGGEIDLAQSKCCQEDWMILLRQGVL